MRNMWGIAIFLLPFIAIGFWILGYTLLNLKRSLQAAKWPTVNGRILSSELVVGRRNSQQVKAIYKYMVGGREFKNDVIAFGYRAGGGHGEVLEKVRAGKAIQVRYDPSDPQNSTLSCGFHKSLQLGLIFSLLWLSMIFVFGVINQIIGSSDGVLLRNIVDQPVSKSNGEI
ncbi:MAG: DUF3592 domain-containing protein [Pirellulales bacterium]